jgi:hypothetical protein
MGEINFREISTPILEKVIQYFYYKLRYTNSTTEIPEFPIEPEVALELLMAANFLVRTPPLKFMPRSLPSDNPILTLDAPCFTGHLNVCLCK